MLWTIYTGIQPKAQTRKRAIKFQGRRIFTELNQNTTKGREKTRVQKLTSSRHIRNGSRSDHHAQPIVSCSRLRDHRIDTRAIRSHHSVPILQQITRQGTIPTQTNQSATSKSRRNERDGKESNQKP